MQGMTRAERPERRRQPPMTGSQERTTPAGVPPVRPTLARRRALGNQAAQRIAAAPCASTTSWGSEKPPTPRPPSGWSSASIEAGSE